MALCSLCLLGENWTNDENKIRVAIQSKMFYLKETKHFTLIFTLTFNRRSSKCYRRNSTKIMPNIT